MAGRPKIFVDTPSIKRVRIEAAYDSLTAGEDDCTQRHGGMCRPEVTATALVSAPFELQPGRNVVVLTPDFDPARSNPRDPSDPQTWCPVEARFRGLIPGTTH